MSPRVSDTTRRLASGHSARVLRLVPERFEVMPLFTREATPAEGRIAQELGEARLGRELIPAGPVAPREAETLRLDGLGEVTLFSGRRPQPEGRVAAAPLHLLRLASAALGGDELMVNANHFLFLGPEIGPWDAYGDPVGLVVSAGQVEVPPQLPRACLVHDGVRAGIRVLGFADCAVHLSDRVLPAHPLGPPRTGAEPVAFALFHGSVEGSTPAAPGAWEVAVVGRRPVAIKEGGGMPIPRAGCVLRLPDRAAAEALAGETVTYALDAMPSEAVQSGPAIVAGGQIVPPERAALLAEHMAPHDGLADSVPVSPHAWAADWHETRAARLSAGVTAEGELFFCAVEGTSSFHGGRAEGATLHDLAALMAEEGAEVAMHLDGGASTQVFGAGGGALLTSRDIHHGRIERTAQYDRPLPLALRLF